MFFARLSGFVRTLRFQLMVWNAVVVILTGFATLVGLREGVRVTLIRELDAILVEDLREIGIAMPALGYPASGELEAELHRKASVHLHHGWFVQLLDLHSREHWASVNTPAVRPRMPEIGDGIPVSVGEVRLVQRTIRDGQSPPVIVRVGASMGFIQSDLSRIDRLVALAAGVVLLVAPACGYWLAGRATRPLAAIIDTTGRLRPDRLDERLPIRDTGDELDRLSHTVNSLLDRIAVYLQEKRDFLANAAHELRTPLAAIRSTAEVALAGTRSPEEYQSLLDLMIDESTSLEMLVNQLLLLAESDIERLKVHREKVDLGDVVRKAAAMFAGAAEHRGISLQCAIAAPAIVEGNRHHLRQVLNNLLDNAIRFTPKGGRIDVTLDSAGGAAVLQVVDTGSGITEADLPHVFERFYRGDRSRQREGASRGTGLGLSICRAIVGAHGGEIRVESQSGQHTIFTVTLPLRPPCADPLPYRPDEAARRRL